MTSSVKGEGLRVVVTGAAGFVGTHVVKQLFSRGYRVFAIEHKSADITPIESSIDDVILVDELRDSLQLSVFFSAAKPSAIIHLAAIVRPAKESSSISRVIRTNVELGTHIVQACLASGVKYFINTGSFWEETVKSGEYKPVNLYAASKRAFQDILEYYIDSHHIAGMTLRLFGNYGPGDNRRNLFASLRESCGSVDPVPFGRGIQRLDLVSIQDVVQAYELALTKTPQDLGFHHRILEIGTGETLSLQEIADAYSSGCGKPLNIAWGAREDRAREPSGRAAAIETAMTTLGWKARISMARGIADLARVTHCCVRDQSRG